MIAGTMAKRTQRKDVGAWLGGNRGTVQSRLPSDAGDREAKVDAGGGQMEQVRGELGLGAYTAGIGTTAAIGAGVAAIKSGKVVNPVAAAKNKLTGKTVMVHGSPVSGLKQIEPRAGSNMAPGESVVFGWNPRVRNAKTDIPSGVTQYTYKEGVGSGSAYVVKVPKSSTKKRGDILPQYLTSTESAKVVAEIPAGTSTFSDQIQRQLRRAGVRPKGDTFFGDLQNDKVLALRLRAEQAKNKLTQGKKTPPSRY
jgi:hypothetical protein